MARFGMMQFRSMSSLLFVGFRYTNPFNIAFKKCNGYFKKYFYMNENEQCVFNLNSDLTNGDVKVEFWDMKNNLIFMLNNVNKTETFMSDAKTKYKIIFRFDNASGKITFGWK